MRRRNIVGTNIREALGDEADYLLGHECKTIEREKIDTAGSRFCRPGAGAK